MFLDIMNGSSLVDDRSFSYTGQALLLVCSLISMRALSRSSGLSEEVTCLRYLIFCSNGGSNEGGVTHFEDFLSDKAGRSFALYKSGFRALYAQNDYAFFVKSTFSFSRVI